MDDASASASGGASVSGPASNSRAWWSSVVRVWSETRQKLAAREAVAAHAAAWRMEWLAVRSGVWLVHDARA